MWVITILCSLAGLIVVTLCVPLDMTLHVDTRERPKFRMRLEWLFGLLGKEIRKAEKKPKKNKEKVKVKKGLRERRKGLDVILKILRVKGLVKQLIDFLRDIFGSLRIRDLGANFRVGFDNPADTGLLFAFIGPVTHFLNSPLFHQIKVQPSFGEEAVFEGSLYGTVRLLPIRLVSPFLRIIFSLPTIRIVKILALSKWKRKG